MNDVPVRVSSQSGHTRMFWHADYGVKQLVIGTVARMFFVTGINYCAYGVPEMISLTSLALLTRRTRFSRSTFVGAVR